MTSGLEAASAAYQSALKRVTDAQAAVKDARDHIPDARAKLAEAIVAAYQADVKVGEIARITGYGREQVRRILRAGGVQAPTRD